VNGLKSVLFTATFGSISPNALSSPPPTEKLDQTTLTLINDAFDYVRGQYSLWGPERQGGEWSRVIVPALPLAWVIANVFVMYPSYDPIEVDSLDGIVLWCDPLAGQKTGKLFSLLEGNHRISAWLNRQTPPHLKATIYVGIRKKKNRAPRVR